MKLLLGLLFFTQLAMGAGSSLSCTTRVLTSHRLITCDFVGDSATGAIPTLEIGLGGFVAKVVTNPGSVGPTDNYDIACGDPSDTTLDIFGGALANRDTLNTEQVYPVISGATMPVFASTCTLQITNNSVNSATGTIEFYVLKP